MCVCAQASWQSASQRPITNSIIQSMCSMLEHKPDKPDEASTEDGISTETEARRSQHANDQPRGLRVAPWDETCTAYNYDGFCKYYGGDAWAVWRRSEKVTDRYCNWLVCWVRIGNLTRKCPVEKLRSCGSRPIMTLLDFSAQSREVIECFVDLNEIAGTTNEESAAHLLQYFLDESMWWESHCPHSGDLDLVDRLQIVHLQWLVKPEIWWSWFHARQQCGVMPMTGAV